MRYSAAASRNLTDDRTRRLVASYTGKYAAVIPDFKMQPGMLYTQVRAISARINQNYDAWPSDELKKSFRTFLGKPVFVNHQNFDPEKARGRVVAARYRESGNDRYIEVIQEIDAVRFPKLAKEIHEGGLDSVSMGVEAGFTKCSVCDNRATDISDMCDHVKHHKGETLRHAKTGDPTLVYENCYKLGFFELSYVFDPADETAVVSRVVVANNKTAKPRMYHYPDKENHPNYFVEITHDESPAPAQSDKPEKKRRRLQDKILDDLSMDQKIRRLKDMMDKYPRDQFLPARTARLFAASAANEVDWADMGRQAAEQGGPPTADENPDVAIILSSLPPEEADFVRSRYEQGYAMTKQARVAAAADDDQSRAMAQPQSDLVSTQGAAPAPTNPAQDDKTTSTMQNLTSGDLAGMPSAPTSYEMIPGASFSVPGGGSGGSGGGGSSSGGNGYQTAPSGGTMNDNRLLPGTQALNDILLKQFPGTEIGGYREDPAYPDEHPAGKALDFMTTDLNMGNSAIQTGFSNGADYAIWQNQMWYPDGRTAPYTGPNPHTDHVHLHHPGGLISASRKRVPMNRYAWGEIEAPEDIDTLRDESDDDGSDEFHHYVESPDELRTPDFDKAKRLDRDQEDAGLDADRRVEDVEEVGIPTRKGGKRMPYYRYAEDFGGDPSMMGGDPSMGGQPPMDPSMMGGQPPMDPSMGGGFGPGSMSPEEELALLNQAQGDLSYAESELYGGGAPADQGGGEEDWDYSGQGQPYADDSGQPDGDGDEDDESYEDEGDEEEADPSSIPPQIEARRRGEYRPVRNTASQKNVRRTQKGRSMGINLSERGKVASRGRRFHADDNGHVDGGPYGRNDQGEQEEIFLSQTPAEEAVANPSAGDSISNTENTLVARVQRGTDQLRRDAAALARLRQRKQAAEGDGTEAGSGFGEGLIQAHDPANAFGEIAQNNGLQQLGNRYASLCRQAGVRPTKQGFRRFLAGDNIVEPTTVNPELSGTNDQSLKGDDFDNIALDNVPTQPKDASIHAFAAFDDWLARTTGKTARQHGNANFIRREAARYIRATGLPLNNLFPTLEKVLVEARKAETTKEANMKRVADEKLEVAAPGDRIDVEAPVSNVTDADAQASQYALSDYGNNAGDNLASPDLSTDSQFWAPGGGEKTSNRTADAVAAVRCAEAYINAGLAPSSEKWKLIARFQTMRHATVVDRTRLLEAKNELDASSRQRSAAVSRGTSIPRGLGSGQRTAQTNRIAANDPSSDSLLFFK